jgi:hypothetical protein
LNTSLTNLSLEPSDRDALKSAASKLSTHANIGSLVGLGLGLALAWRIRSTRVKMFEAFKASKKPTHVRFADGREGSSFIYLLKLPVL